MPSVIRSRDEHASIDQDVLPAADIYAVLITGPSLDGIGAETAYSLAKASPHLLILAGRNETIIQPVIEKLEATGTRTQFLHLDLSSVASIRAAVEQLVKGQHVTDVLINNAAVMACPFALNEDGIEKQFATNFIGPALFTNLLLEAGLIKHRIVNVSSSASVGKAESLMAPLEDLTYANGATYNPFLAYSTSKMALNLYTKHLAEMIKSNDMTVFCLNPGSIKSPLQRHFTEEGRAAAIATLKRDNPDFVMPKIKTLQQGCATQLRAALDPSIAAESGRYLDHCQFVEHQEHLDAAPAEERVWSILEKATGTTLHIK